MHCINIVGKSIECGGGYSCDTMLTSPVDNTAMGRVGVCLVGGPGANKKSCG